VSVALQSRVDAAFLQNVGDRAASNLMYQIGQCALDSCIAPGRILVRHSQNKFHNCLHGARPARTAPIAMSDLRATSSRYHFNSVSGLTRVSSSSNALRPSDRAFRAHLQRSGS
jgi:hypothetical protein